MTFKNQFSKAQERTAPERHGEPSSTESAPDAGPRLTIEEKTAELRVRRRDCRSCKAFRQDESGMSFGWCTAFEQYVKLYHPAGEFWSQCQFKVIARTPCSETPPAAPAAAGRVSPAPRAAWVPLPATE